MRQVATTVTVHAHQEGASRRGDTVNIGCAIEEHPMRATEPAGANSDPFDKLAADRGWNPLPVGESMTVTIGTKCYAVTRISCDNKNKKAHDVD